MEDFKDRLEKSCDASVDIPDHGFGRQVVLAKAMGVSQEGVRKWFAGESKPRTSAMKKLAALLNVDYAWLSIGAELLGTQKFRAVARHQNAGVYALTSFLISAGCTVAFTEDLQDDSDITAVSNGKLLKFLAIPSTPISNKTAEFDIENKVTNKGVTSVGCIFKDYSNKSSIIYDFVDLTGLPQGTARIKHDQKNNCYKSGKKILQPLTI